MRFITLKFRWTYVTSWGSFHLMCKMELMKVMSIISAAVSYDLWTSVVTLKKGFWKRIPETKNILDVQVISSTVLSLLRVIMLSFRCTSHQNTSLIQKQVGYMCLKGHPTCNSSECGGQQASHLAEPTHPPPFTKFRWSRNISLIWYGQMAGLEYVHPPFRNYWLPSTYTALPLLIFSWTCKLTPTFQSSPRGR